MPDITFGRLTVPEMLPGRKARVLFANLINGSTKSCGCLRCEHKHQMGNTLLYDGADITGQSFGRLTAVEYTGKTDKYHNRIWRFRCSGGREVELARYRVTSWQTQSCGCLRREKRV